MIYVEMNGRLGNQLFRYAFARSIQKKYYNNEEICLSFNEVDEAGKKDSTFSHEILNFNINYASIYNKQGKLLLNETSFLQKVKVFPYFLFSKKINPKDIISNISLTKKFYNMYSKSGIYWYRYGYFEPLFSREKNKIVSGTFESSKYFNNIKEILIEEFQPRYPINTQNYELISTIKNTNSVCVSIRRGDFLNPENSLHNVCTINYFYKALKYISKKIENPVFIFFSDDIDWVKKNIKIDGKAFYERGNDPVYEKLALMYSCKHFIISNSTFSWWAQYLSKNKNKIVISPEFWFKDIEKYDLIEDSFIKLGN